ncbi:rifin [Plasmodium falciparum IGH-CR14]|uniref:Rifin n=1 Tax=Plasmodium falciparum IGH-CR14 TaxID=580059 RepID=A0A0L1I3W1_PLAFA|nr:rifin [Plasmodium falciparum IGH-CR14]
MENMVSKCCIITKACKEQCDKDIQKIILKDKIEKELTENFSSLQTDISTNDIPTCICEKSVADKVEKTCLKCGGILGGGIAPGWSLVSGLGYMAWTQYITAKVFEEGIKKGLEVGLVKVTEIVTQMIRNANNVPSIDILQKITTGNFSDGVSLYGIFKTIDSTISAELETQGYFEFSLSVQTIAQNPTRLKLFSQKVADVTNAVADGEATVLTEAAPVTSGLNTAIIASIVAIVVIILVMLIIYLILRYRRKKKIHKKLQYIKLLQQ